MNRLAKTSAPLHPLLAERWSPRAFDESFELNPEQTAALLEAARWTPSSSNSQPWRFLVAKRGEVVFDAIFDSLMDGNKLWAGSASALIVAGMEASAERPVAAAYDVGQAVAMMSVQAQSLGLATHQIGGFHKAELTQRLDLADIFNPLTVIAIGKLGRVEQLTDELAQREVAPRTRKELNELVVHVDVAEAEAS